MQFRRPGPFTFAVLVSVVFLVSPTTSWYDRTVTPDEIHTYGERKQNKKHNPVYGTQLIRQATRTDEDWLRLFSEMKARQATDKRSRSALRSHFNTPPQIGQFVPRSGPSVGGTPIRIWGTNFGDGTDVYKCRFGKRVVNATYEAKDRLNPTILCRSPPYRTTKSRSTSVSFSILIFSNHRDRVDHIASHKRKFNYYDTAEIDPVVVDVKPLVGPLEGGTVVKLSGKNLRGGTFYSCRFGNITVPAVFSEGLPSLDSIEEHLTCKSPKFSRPATVDLDLILSGVLEESILPGVSGYSFTFYRTPKDVVLSKRKGPAAGGTYLLLSSVWLTKAALHPSAGPFQCRFGKTTTVPAVLMASGEMSCFTPPKPRTKPRTSALLELERQHTEAKENKDCFGKDCVAMDREIAAQAAEIIADHKGATLRSSLSTPHIRKPKFTKQIIDTHDILNSITTRLKTRKPKWTVCETQFWRAENAINKFVKNLTSTRVSDYCAQVHRIKDFFCESAPGCLPGKDDHSLLQYSCSTMTVLAEKYYTPCSHKAEHKIFKAAKPVSILHTPVCPIRPSLSMGLASSKSNGDNVRISWNVRSEFAKQPQPGHFVICVFNKVGKKQSNYAEHVLKHLHIGKAQLLLSSPKYSGNGSTLNAQLVYFQEPAIKYCQTLRSENTRQVCGEATLKLDNPLKLGNPSELSNHSVVQHQQPTFSHYPLYTNISLCHRQYCAGPNHNEMECNFEGYQVCWFNLHDDEARKEVNHDLICMYEMEQQGEGITTDEVLPPKPVYMDGFKANFYAPGKIPLPPSLKYEGKTIVIRYEHKYHKNDTCYWEWPREVRVDGRTERRELGVVDTRRNWSVEFRNPDVWGELYIRSFPKLPKRSYTKTKGAKQNTCPELASSGESQTETSVEVTFNGQQYHNAGNFLYIDENSFPDTYTKKDCTLAHRPTLSFKPSISKLGSYVRVKGLSAEDLRDCVGPPENKEVIIDPPSASLSGGTNITVYGYRPLPGIDYTCRFGDLHMVAYRAAGNTLVCKSPPYAVARKVTFAVSFRMTDIKAWEYNKRVGLSGTAMPLSLNRKERYEFQILPSVPETDATKQIITFNFGAVSNNKKTSCIKCQIGNAEVDGLYDVGTGYVNSKQALNTKSLHAPSVFCPIPKCLGANTKETNAFSVKVGNKIFNQFTFQKPILRLLNPPELVELKPDSASCTDPIGFTVKEIPEGITAIFLHFGLHKSVRCRSNGIVWTDFKCDGGVPLLKPGVYQARLSYNRVDLSPPMHEFVYRNKLHPYYIAPNRINLAPGEPAKLYTFSYQFSPNAGPIKGDTQLVFLGHNFDGGRDYKCRFGGMVVPAWFKFTGGSLGRLFWYKQNWVSGHARGTGEFGAGGGRHGQITCFSPRVKRAGFVPVCLSVDGISWSCDNFKGFHYYNDEGTRHVAHSSGSPLGGTQVLITGSLVFQMAAPRIKFVCKFGKKRTSGMFDYALNALRCINPPGIDGNTVPLSISLNDEQYEYIDQFEYKFGDDKRFLNVTRGPSRGGTVVLVKNILGHIIDDTKNDEIKKIRRLANTLKERLGLAQSKLNNLHSKKRSLAEKTKNAKQSLLQINDNNRKRQAMLRSALDEASVTKKMHLKHYFNAKDSKTMLKEQRKKVTALKSSQSGVASTITSQAIAVKKLRVAFWKAQSRYNAMARRRILAFSAKRRVEAFFCKFGKEEFPGKLKGKSLACIAPRSDILGEVKFGVYFQDKSGKIDVIMDLKRPAWKLLRTAPVFSYYGNIRVENQVSVSTELGGEMLHLPGVNFTGESEYYVKFGRFTVSAIYDGYSESLIVKVPPMRPGPVAIQVSGNRQDFTKATSLHYVLFSNRATVLVIGDTEFDILYAGTKNMWETNISMVQVEVSTLNGDGDEGEKTLIKMLKTGEYGRYKWHIKHELGEGALEFRISRFILTASRPPRATCTTHESNTDFNDDNKGRGWAYRKRMAKGKGKNRWLETARSVARSSNSLVLLNLTQSTKVDVRAIAETIGDFLVTGVNKDSRMVIVRDASSIKIDDRVRGGALPDDCYVIKKRKNNITLQFDGIETYSFADIIPSVTLLKITRVQRDSGHGGHDGDADDDDMLKMAKALRKLDKHGKVLAEDQGAHNESRAAKSPTEELVQKLVVAVVASKKEVQLQNTDGINVGDQVTGPGIKSSAVHVRKINDTVVSLDGENINFKEIGEGDVSLTFGVKEKDEIDESESLVCGLDLRKPIISYPKGHRKTTTVEGQYDQGTGVVQFTTPKLVDGSAIVSIKRCGGKPSRDDLTLTADGRYTITPPVKFHMCLAEEGLRLSGQSLPSSGIARKLFDEQIVYDLSEALGMARDRFAVTKVHSETGVVEVDCLGSRSKADTTCMDARKSFYAMVEEYGSMVYDGVLMWALDPMCPHGRMKFIDGVPHITGQCSNPSLLTKYDCLERGKCHGLACDTFKTEKECVKHSNVINHRCSWETTNKFNDNGVLRPFVYFQCSAPGLRNKKSCLAEGTCSDPRYKTMEECLNSGTCKFAKEQFEHLEDRATSKEKCLHPELLLDEPVPEADAGPKMVCHKPRNGPAGFNYRNLKNKLECEVPSSRASIGDIPAVLEEKDLRCCKPVGGAMFDYVQFHNKKMCEVPRSRCAPDTSSKSPAVKDPTDLPLFAVCIQRKDVDYSETIQGESFECEQFKTKEECVEPTKRCNLMRPGCQRYDPTKEGVGINSHEWNVPDDFPDMGIAPDPNGIKRAWGAPCRWMTDASFEFKPRYTDFVELDATYISHRMVYCKEKRYGPAGCWQEKNHTCECAKGFGKDDENMNLEDATLDPRKQPPGVWGPMKPGKKKKPKGPKPKGPGDRDGEEDGEETPDEHVQPPDRDTSSPALPRPGIWTPKNDWKPKNKVVNDGQPKKGPTSDPLDLEHGNSPGMPGGPGCAGPTSGIHKIERLREEKNMISAYQAYVIVGGQELWMQLDTAVATTWVMDAACATEGCSKIPLFSGFFIPFSPGLQVIVDMEYAREHKRGKEKEGGLKGFLGYSFVQIAGHMCIGCPIARATVDTTAPDGVLGSDSLGEGKFNHSGAVSFGFWDDNMPEYMLGPAFNMKDPALDLITFMLHGNIFYPTAGSDLPIVKDFKLWGTPIFPPTAMIFRFSFYYGDKGGCLFMDPGFGEGGKEMYLAQGGLKWVMVMPLSVKFQMPSWLFVMSDVKVRGKSVSPCVFGSCKGSVHTGRFPIMGPANPVLAILEDATPDYMCQNLHELPDIVFTIMGMDFTLGWQQYVVMANKYGNVQCSIAIVPTEVQVFTAFSFWVFGDIWVKAFYSVFERIPLRRIGFAKSNHRYYEANGCACGEGKGPVESMPSQEETNQKLLDEKADQSMESMMAQAVAAEGTIDGNPGGGNNKAGNARQKDALSEQEQNMRAVHMTGNPHGIEGKGEGLRFKMVADRHCPAGMRYTADKRCVKSSVMKELVRIKAFHETQRRKKEAERRKFVSNNFFTPDHKSIRTSAKGVPLSLLEKASSDRRRLHDIQSKPSRATYGPYFPAHEDRCPASKDILEQEQHFFTPPTTKADLLNAAKRIRFRRKKDYKHAMKTSLLEESASGRVELTRDAVSSDKQMAQLIYNVSRLYHSWAVEQNISKKSMSKYWHGETEEYIQSRRKAIAESWLEGLEKARKMLKSSKVKMAINKRVMLRVATQISSPYWREQFLKTEDDRLRGAEVNAADHYGIDVASRHKPVLHPGRLASEHDKKNKKGPGANARLYSTNRFAERRGKLLKNKTWVSERLKKQLQEFPSLWNNSVPFHESALYKLYAPDGVWRNFTEGDRLMKIYNEISKENERHVSSTNKELARLQETFDKHRRAATNVTKHPEVIPHETRRSAGWFNESSGRVILGVTSEISDDETDFQT